jgi:hypothetical protein
MLNRLMFVYFIQQKGFSTATQPIWPTAWSGAGRRWHCIPSTAVPASTFHEGWGRPGRGSDLTA